jgi:hypothetical protein
MRYISLIIALTFAGFVVGGCDLRAFNYGVEKMDPGFITDGYRWYHMGNMDIENWHWDGKNYDYNTVELSRFPEVMDIVVHDEHAFDGPFGRDAESFTDSQRRAMYLNLWCPNRFWDGGFAPAGDGPMKPAFDGHLAL